MRRGSVIGPLILIVIGVLFLLNNMRPDLSLIEMMAIYWPYLLIVWGVLRLGEIVFTWARSNASPMIGMNGGEWVLVVFLCIAGSGLFAFRTHMGHWHAGNVRFPVVDVFGEPFDYPVPEQHLTPGKVSRVLIENFRGNTRVVGEDTTTIKVNGRKTVRAFDSEAAGKADKLTPVEVVTQGDMVVIRTNQDRAQGDNRVADDLEVTVPKGVTIEAHGRYGDFDINDLNGDVEIISDNAGVRAQNLGGGLRVDLRKSDIVRASNVKGQVELKGRWNTVDLENVEGQVIMQGAFTDEMQLRNIGKQVRYDGEQTQFHLERCPGQIRMERGYFNGNNLIGPIRVVSRSKDVQISDFTQGLEVSVDRGDIELRPSGSAKMDVRTRSGDIELALPPSAKFQLRAEVQKGEVTNDFGAPLEAVSEGRGATLKGSVGDGPQIVLATDRGSVTVRKATGESGPLPTKESDEDSDAPKAPHAPKAPPAKPGKLVVETN